MKTKNQKLINGVLLKELKIITDNRGRLMEILRRDDKIFKKFGQCYFTTAFPGICKAWHYHKFQDDHFTCVKGKIKLALYDSRENSSTKGLINEFILSLENPMLVRIPRKVFHGFQTVSKEEAMIINITTKPYNHSHPDEFRIPFDDPSIKFDWSKK